jgi:hypothetical protein
MQGMDHWRSAAVSRNLLHKAVGLGAVGLGALKPKICEPCKRLRRRCIAVYCCSLLWSATVLLWRTHLALLDVLRHLDHELQSVRVMSHRSE